MVSMLRGFSCFGLVVLFSMLSIHDIALLIVSGGTILLRYFRYPIVFISLVVLHNLMHIPVLIRCGIFQITPGTYVSRFSTTVVDNVLSGFLWKFIRGFFVMFRATAVSVPLLELIVFYVRLLMIEGIYSCHNGFWILIIVQIKLGL